MGTTTKSAMGTVALILMITAACSGTSSGQAAEVPASSAAITSSTTSASRVTTTTTEQVTTTTLDCGVATVDPEVSAYLDPLELFVASIQESGRVNGSLECLDSEALATAATDLRVVEGASTDIDEVSFDFDGTAQSATVAVAVDEATCVYIRVSSGGSAQGSSTEPEIALALSPTGECIASAAGTHEFVPASEYGFFTELDDDEMALRADRVAQSNMRNALVAGKVVYADEGDYASATAERLASNEPSLTFQTGPSTGPDFVSIAVADDDASIIFAMMSDSGACFFINDAVGDTADTSGTTFASRGPGPEDCSASETDDLTFGPQW